MDVSGSRADRSGSGGVTGVRSPFFGTLEHTRSAQGAGNAISGFLVIKEPADWWWCAARDSNPDPSGVEARSCPLRQRRGGPGARTLPEPRTTRTPIRRSDNQVGPNLAGHQTLHDRQVGPEHVPQVLGVAVPQAPRPRQATGRCRHLAPPARHLSTPPLQRPLTDLRAEPPDKPLSGVAAVAGRPGPRPSRAARRLRTPRLLRGRHRWPDCRRVP
jgi:hypothetical protein